MELAAARPSNPAPITLRRDGMFVSKAVLSLCTPALRVCTLTPNPVGNRLIDRIFPPIMHILLIEDHLEMVQTLTQSLGVLGIQVESCTDGLLADAALQQHAFDAVVLDLALPRMHGIEILRRLRQRADKVPVLVLTASGDTYDRVQGLNAGADDYLAKPFDLSELEARLRALHRRCVGAVDSVLSVAALEFNTVSRRFALGTHHLDLPPREHDLLRP